MGVNVRIRSRRNWQNRFCGESQLRRCGSTEGSQSFVPGAGRQRTAGDQGATPIGGVEGSRPIRSRVKRLAQRVDALRQLVLGYYLTQNLAGLAALPPSPARNIFAGREEKCLKLTRHNGRSGKHAPTIPGTMTVGSMWKTANTLTLSVPDKMYWDCYRGFTTHDFPGKP